MPIASHIAVREMSIADRDCLQMLNGDQSSQSPFAQQRVHATVDRRLHVSQHVTHGHTHSALPRARRQRWLDSFPRAQLELAANGSRIDMSAEELFSGIESKCSIYERSVRHDNK